MLYDLLLADRAKINNIEKEECKELILHITDIARKVWKKGLLSIEYGGTIDQEKDPILQKGLQLIVDGTDPEIVKNILSAYIYHGSFKEKRLLELIMILDGVLLLQYRTHPDLIKKLEDYGTIIRS